MSAMCRSILKCSWQEWGGCSEVVIIVIDVRESEPVVVAVNAQTCEHAAGKNRTTSACGFSSDVHVLGTSLRYLCHGIFLPSGTIR